MITWKATLNVKYENLLVLVEVARVYYCVSTTICEKTFLMQGYINTKYRNKMLTKKWRVILELH